MSNSKPKIAYILPFYEEGTDTHLFYNYLLIKEASKKLDISVVVEKEQKFKWPPLRFLEMFWILLKKRREGYQNFYVHYSYYGALAALVLTWRLSRQVRVFYWNRGMPWLYRRGWFEESVFKFILRHTILVTGPESLAKEYQKRYGVKEYRVLSNWVDVRRFAPSQTRTQAFQDTNIRLLANFSARAGRTAQDLEKLALESAGKSIILFVHHLSKRKGADLIPEIAKGFGDDVLFLVAGDGPELENLKKVLPKTQILQDLAQPGGASRAIPQQRDMRVLAKSGVEAREASNVVLLGKVPNSKIPNLLRSADIFLMPSREEGSPHVLLEAMASGVPFVASDVGGVRELVPDGVKEFLCAPEDVKCFQNKLKTLLADKALYDNARKTGLEHAKKFDISRGVEEFTGLFK